MNQDQLAGWGLIQWAAPATGWRRPTWWRGWGFSASFSSPSPNQLLPVCFCSNMSFLEEYGNLQPHPLNGDNSNKFLLYFLDFPKNVQQETKLLILFKWLNWSDITSPLLKDIFWNHFLFRKIKKLKLSYENSPPPTTTVFFMSVPCPDIICPPGKSPGAQVRYCSLKCCLCRYITYIYLLSNASIFRLFTSGQTRVLATRPNMGRRMEATPNV